MAQNGSANAAVDPPMVLPIPATISMESGAKGASATLTYTLSADQNRTLECRYRSSGSRLSLKSCDRSLDATSFVESSAVKLVAPDRRSRVHVVLCPDGPVIDVASQGPQPNEKFPRMDQLRAEAVPVQGTPGGRTVKDVDDYVEVAMQDMTVRALLGDRSAFIHEVELQGPKGEPRDHAHLRLIFFSHTTNRTVEVVIRGKTIESAGYITQWPPEGKAEIDEAIALALQDPRLPTQAMSLHGGGMVWQPTEDVPYVGHRVMDIRFYDTQLVARAFARVDLTDLVVQQAGVVQ